MSEQLELVTDDNLDRITRRFDGGAGSGNNGSMEARVAKLEASMEFVQRDIAELKADVRQIRTTDFRIIFSAIIGVALGLAGLMAKGFNWL